MTRREWIQSIPAFAGINALWSWAKPRPAREPEYFWWYYPIEFAHEYEVGQQVDVQIGDLRLPHVLTTKTMRGRIVEKHYPSPHGQVHDSYLYHKSDKVAFKCEIIR